MENSPAWSVASGRLENTALTPFIKWSNITMSLSLIPPNCKHCCTSFKFFKFSSKGTQTNVRLFFFSNPVTKTHFYTFAYMWSSDADILQLVFFKYIYCLMVTLVSVTMAIGLCMCKCNDTQWRCKPTCRRCATRSGSAKCVNSAGCCLLCAFAWENVKQYLPFHFPPARMHGGVDAKRFI